MDIETIRTFLKIVDTGSFVQASKSLHFTQAAISRRIKSLESYLGCKLFVRSKAGTTLTPAGKRFLRYATKMLQTLERARHEVGVAPSYKNSLTIGGRFGLWSDFLLIWLQRMNKDFPEMQIRAEIGFEENLMQDLIDGCLDIGIMYTPQNRPTLQVDWLLEEELILVTTNESHIQMPSPETYVHVDWGPEFLAQLNYCLPEYSSPQIIVGIAWLGLQHILSMGGSGFFPRRLVQNLIKQSRLFPVPSAPSFKLPAYVVYPSKPTNPMIHPALQALRQVATKTKL